MVCSTDDLLEWKDFPKGLRVLLLDEDNHSAEEIKLKLEEMDYVVSTFHNEDEALKAISNKYDSYHVAIVEVSTGNCLGSFKFLENAKNLPTIMTSNIHCLSTMMKCIAHGAAEFLQKPLSEDKLKNIWQHVVHKAFNAGEDAVSESMKPIKETVASMLHLKLESSTEQNENQELLKTVDIETNSTYELCDPHNEQSMTTDKFPAPSTPQLKQIGRCLDDEDCQETTSQDQQQNNSSMEKEHGEPADGECSKSVDTTNCNNSVDHLTTMTTTSSSSNVVDDALIIKEEEKASPGDTKTTESNLSSQLQTKDGIKDSNAESRNRKKASLHPNSCGSRANRKKMKVDWTTDLHKRFVQAVEQLGVDQAIPSRILELMKAEGLTRHNVASHLQKYRLNRRHILPKEDNHHQDRIRWQSSPSMQRTTTNYHHQHNKPIMAYPSLPLPYHHALAHHHHQHQPVCHVWGHPAAPSNHQMWSHHLGFPSWQHPDSRIWKGANTTSYPAAAAAGFHQMNVDGWGNPVNHVMPSLSHHQVQCTTYPQAVQNVTGYAVEDHSNSMGDMISSFHLQDGDDEEENLEKLLFIDKIVREAMSKPWLPLPLGLNPPSTESVLNELQRQGIHNIPPPPPPPPHPKHHHHHPY